MAGSILIVTAFAPSERTAGQNYTLQLITDLAKEYRVDLIYFNSNNECKYNSTDPRISVIQEINIGPIKKLLNVIKTPFFHPLFSCRFSYRLASKIRAISYKYDYLYFDFSQVALYQLLVKHNNKFIMLHDVIAQKYSRKSHNFLYANYLFAYLTELFILKLGKPQLLCFSNKDVQLVESYYNRRASRVDFYINSKIKNLEKSLVDTGEYFVFFGAWNRKENSEGLSWFLVNVMPLLGSPIDIRIIGGGLSQELIEKAERFDGVSYLGFVPNPYPIILLSKGLIAPIHQGAGVKVKVVESLALGTPVIGTSVAFEGIDFVNKKHLRLAHKPSDYISAINTLKTITTSEKAALRRDFHNNYPKDMFTDFVKQRGGESQ